MHTYNYITEFFKIIIWIANEISGMRLIVPLMKELITTLKLPLKIGTFGTSNQDEIAI